MRKAYAYIRVSTQNQVEEGLGLEIQSDHILKFAQTQDFEITKIFTDEAISGSLRDRPALLNLLKEIDANGVRDVIVYREDRLARDLAVSLWIEKEFQKREVRLHCSAEPNFDDPDDPMQKAFRHIRNVFAELERDTITLRLLSGRRQKVSHGEYGGGRPPFGYRAENGKLIIDHVRAEVVKRIFAMREESVKGKPMTMQAIADELNREGIRFSGKRTYASSIQQVLANRLLYEGTIKYGSVKTKGTHTPILQPH